MRRIALLLGTLALTLSAALATIGTSAASAATTPTIAASAATAVAPTAATMNGSLNLEGGTLDVLQAGISTGGVDTTGCYFEYGTSTTYGSYESCSPTPANASSAVQAVAGALTGLTAGQTYHFRVVMQIEDSSVPVLGTLTGSTEYDSTDQSFTTPSTTTLPTVATAAATNVGGSSVILNGSVNPENYPVTSCTFTYGQTGGTTTTTPCTSLPSAGTANASVSAPLVGLDAGTAYTYSLSVGYGSGTTATASSTSSSSFTTTAATISTPQAVTATSAAMVGTVNPEGQSVTSCTFYYGTAASKLLSTPCSQAAGSISGSSPVNVSVTVSGLSQKSNYIDTIVLVTAQGQAVATAGSFTTLATPTGTTTKATAVTATTATLHATVNAGGEGVTACAFEWGVNALTSSSSPGSDLALVEQCTATPAANGNQNVTVTLKGLAPKTKYYYRVLLTTYGGYVIGNTVSFQTSAAAMAPTLRITATKLNAKIRAAKFSFARTGSTVATRGFQCSLVTVTKGKVAKARYSTCTSGRTYTKLKTKTTYVFSTRAGNAVGYGRAVTHRFTI